LNAGRFFFALWPDRACARGLEKLGERVAEDCGGKRVPVEKIHLTLAFLGAIDVARREDAIEAASRVRGTAFELVLDRIGSFRRAGVAWAGASTVPQSLVDLHGGLERRLRDTGIDLEGRPFAPHVTLARRARRALPESPIDALRWNAGAFTLVRSDTATGLYAIERSWRLGV
jgi:2'-5' RNA ligase